jgi:hypothetical protein
MPSVSKKTIHFLFSMARESAPVTHLPPARRSLLLFCLAAGASYSARRALLHLICSGCSCDLICAWRSDLLTTNQSFSAPGSRLLLRPDLLRWSDLFWLLLRPHLRRLLPSTRPWRYWFSSCPAQDLEGTDFPPAPHKVARSHHMLVLEIIELVNVMQDSPWIGSM